jgi:type III secretion system (T3SS) SseB-like protein
MFQPCHGTGAMAIRDCTGPTPSGSVVTVGLVDPRRTLAPSPFPADDGKASPETRRLLAAATPEAGSIAYLRAIAALCLDRLLVPVVATATRLGQTAGGLTSDKEAEMAVVLLQASDGRRALLAFTGLDALQAWQGSARPVPVTLDRAAQTALAEGATAVLLDCAGPASLVVEGDLLDQLAAGCRLIETSSGEFGWLVPVSEQGPE